jgi:ankyrin repeat protein
MIKRIWVSGANVNAQDNKGRIPRHIPSPVEITRLLLDSQAEVNARTYLGQTPLHLLSGRYNTKIFELLLSAGAEVNAVDRKGKSPLHLVTILPWDLDLLDSELSAIWTRASREIDAKDRKERTPLHLAILYHIGDLDNLIAMWVRAGAKVNDIDHYGDIILYITTFSMEQLVRLLLESGANVNAIDESGMTPLHNAERSGLVRIAQISLSSAAKRPNGPLPI